MPGVTIRPARLGDVPLIADLYRRLSPDTFAERFMSARVEGAAERLARFDPDRGDVVLLAGLPGPPGTLGRLVAEARYVPTGDEVAEFAVVVLDDHRRRGIGGRLLAELLSAAERQGLRRLSALVSGGNTAMLRLVNRLGWALVEAPEGGTGLLEVSAVGGMPGWPDDGRRRVLVESRGWFENAETTRLRASGAAVRRCPGPQRDGPGCPLVTDGTCRLAEEADEIVALLPDTVPGCAAVRAAHETRWPGRLTPPPP